MRRLIGFGLALAVVSTIGAVASASAWAVVEIPEFSLESKFNGTSGAESFKFGSLEIKCTLSESTGLPLSDESDEVMDIHKSCSLESKTCHSEGAAEGVILMTAEYMVVRLKSNSAGVLIHVYPTKILCGTPSTKVELEGDVLGLVEPLKTKATHFTISIKTIAGKQEHTLFENREGVKEKAELLASVNGGAFKAATTESTENKITTEKETEIKFILPWLSVTNVAPGVGPRGEGSCLFTAATQKCSINFKNVSLLSPVVVEVKFQGNVGAFRKVTTNCTLNLVLGECTDEIEVTTFQAGSQDYCMLAREQIGVHQQNCATLRM